MRKSQKKALTYVTPNGQPLSWWDQRAMNVTKHGDKGLVWGDVHPVIGVPYLFVSVLCFVFVPAFIAAAVDNDNLGLAAMALIPVILLGGPWLVKAFWNNKVRPFLKRKKAQLLRDGNAAMIPTWHLRAWPLVEALNEAETAARGMQSGMRAETLRRIISTRWNLVCMTDTVKTLRAIMDTAPERLEYDQYMDAVDVLRESDEALEALLVTASTLCDTVTRAVEMEKASSVEAVLAANKAVEGDLALIDAAKVRLQLLAGDETDQTQALLAIYTRALATAGR